MKQSILQFIHRPWSKEEKMLTVLSATLLGIVLGLIFSPFQKGINIMSHNGCNNKSKLEATNGENKAKEALNTMK